MFKFSLKILRIDYRVKQYPAHQEIMVDIPDQDYPSYYFQPTININIDKIRSRGSKKENLTQRSL